MFAIAISSGKYDLNLVAVETLFSSPQQDFSFASVLVTVLHVNNACT